jgi:hypothetical protein
MKNKNILFAILLLAFATNFTAEVNAQSTQQHRVVMQLSSADTMVWKGLMNNLRNLKAGWGDSVIIEVVAHGPGIEMMMKDKTTQLANIKKHKMHGINFYVCENTMREKQIAYEAIIGEGTFVKMGIGHVILRQEQGWSYIKAGF